MTLQIYSNCFCPVSCAPTDYADYDSVSELPPNVETIHKTSMSEFLWITSYFLTIITFSISTICTGILCRVKRTDSSWIHPCKKTAVVSFIVIMAEILIGGYMYSK